MCSEIGYAYAKNKKIILVDQVNNKYWDFIKELCDDVYSELEQGIEALKIFCSNYYN